MMWPSARPCAPVFLSPEALHTELKRRGLNDAWYALTFRGHQANGEFVEITQIRRLSEAADHLDELQAVMATAAGRPPRFEDGVFRTPGSRSSPTRCKLSTRARRSPG